MLKQLQVKDYALIEYVDVEFKKGLNIITGETGAGKSILIDALSLLLGERASTESVRKGAQKSYVEGIFDVETNKKVHTYFNDNELEFSPELILRREISLKGTNRCFINDSPVPLAVFKELGNLLVDLHGQHEHQSLLRTETHIDFLDESGTPAELMEDYKLIYSGLRKKEHELSELLKKENSIKEKKDIYEFQIKEIDAVAPVEDEEEKLNGDLKIIENSEKLLELTSSTYNLLYESENSAYDALTKVRHNIEELEKIDKSFGDILNDCISAVTLTNEIADFIRNYNSHIDVDPQQADTIRERLGALNMLKKKYGGSLKNVLEFRNKIGEECRLAGNFSAAIEQLEDEITGLRKKCGAAADKLTQKRKETAAKIEKDIAGILKHLGIPNPVFKVKIVSVPAGNEAGFIISEGKKYNADNKGKDEVEFFIATNLGEDVKPLAKVASGGEISRIMLALKSILAKNDKLPLLIFDEIDTGVSGRVAQKVGHSLKELASFHQVIAITHLPQIAALADSHYNVEKKVINERVISSIRLLEEEERVGEVAKLISGEDITEAGLKTAKELMNLSD